MASPVLPKGEQNFIRFVKICLDVLKLPLADTLASEIQPADLYNKIQHHCSLLIGKNKLSPTQMTICYLSPPTIPKYNKFDVTLLYKLLRNLCPSLEPTNGWGKDPVDADIQIGDDIERLRIFRNNNVHHGSSEITDIDFEKVWKKLKSVLQRIQNHMASKGYNVNYEENMIKIKQLDLGDELIDKYKIAYLMECTIERLNQADGIEGPMISIEGQSNVLCGNSATFNAVIYPENLKGWSVTWQKIEKLTLIGINTNKEKYSGSTEKKIVIQSVCKEDEGEYRAILSKDLKANNICVSSNAIVLQAIGDVPNAEISTERPVYFGSTSRFKSRIVSCPSPDGVKWQHSNDGKTFESIIISKPKYYGSSCDPKSPLLIIRKVSFEDRLNYRLFVWNKIGEQHSNTVFLDVKGSVPNITISHRTCVSNRSISLVGDVFVYGDLPAIQSVFWTKNGKEINTEGSGGKYTKVTVDNPSLTIFEANEFDAGSYQLTATNAVGSTSSEFLILDVPDVSMAIHEQKNGRILFTVTTKSIPAPYFAQWSIKEKYADTFIPIDEQVEEFKGTSNTLPHPVLVVNPKIDLENYCFQVEVRNFIGSCKQITPVKKDEAGSDDLSTNDNQGGRLSEFYLDGGAGLKFAKLFDDIAEHFPEKKTKRLKNFIQYSYKVKDMTLFAQTVSARDCLEILCDHKLFIPWDVIFMQYLLKNTECMDLFEKCVEYAEAHGALCFYEKVPENGFRNVQFHVNGNISCYTPVEIRRIKETVAAIVGCKLPEVDVNGYRHSSSFLTVLSIEKKYVRKLLTMTQKEKDKLSRLNIDYFIVDFITVYLQSPKEMRGEENNDEYPIMLQNLLKISKDERIDCREKKSPLLLLQKSYALPKGGTAHGRALFEKPSTDLDSDISYMYNAIRTARINVSAKEVKHISCLMSNRFWVSDMKTIKEIDEYGRILRELNLYFTLFGSHTLTKGGDLLFLKDNDVYMLTLNGEISNLFIHASVHFCIHSSKANGDILIGDINIVTRFNMSGMKLNQIEFDDEGQSLYEETIFITENKNGDIIVSDNGKKAIIVTDKSGRYLFNYKGHHSQTTFHPGGICTDIFGHILVCNVSGDPSVHLLDKKGRFMAHLLTKHQHGSDCPQALCVDSVHNLYVGYSNKNKINVFKYLGEDMLFEFYMEKNQPNVKTELTETRRIPWREFNVAHETNLKAEWAVEPSDQLPEGPPTPPKKPFFKFDKYHEEKGSEKSDSETRLKSYSDPNVTHATSSVEQTIQNKSGNKKPPYWLISVPPVPPRMKIYSLETKNSEKNEGKTESETRSKSYSDPNVTHATSSDEKPIRLKSDHEKPSYGLISGPPFSLRKKVDCFDTQNAEETDSAPPIPPRIQLPRVQSCIAATKEKDFASAPPIPPRIQIPKIRPCDSATIEEHSDLVLYTRERTKWKEDDRVFLETHSFSLMLDKVRKQPFVTFVGVPGSGKTATVRHITLILQQEGYDIFPIKEINKIEDYCDQNIPQVFVIDDVLGVFGLNEHELYMIDKYSERLSNPVNPKTKTLLTCREAVFRHKMLSRCILAKKDNVVNLQNQENALNDDDKQKLLVKYNFDKDLLCPRDLALSSNMFPLLCKLFSNEKELNVYGPTFFISPVPCILEQMNLLEIRNKHQYVALVLLMANENKLSEKIFDNESNEHKQTKKGTLFAEMKCNILRKCEVPSTTESFHLINALSEMDGTYTKKSDNEFVFIHDSMFEIIAYHFGRRFPELILQYASSNYIANYIKVDKYNNQNGSRGVQCENDRACENNILIDNCHENEKKVDLYIQLHNFQYPLLAERLFKDVQRGEFYDVFGNDVLKNADVLKNFITELEKKSYDHLYDALLSEIANSSKICKWKYNEETTGVKDEKYMHLRLNAHRCLINEIFINGVCRNSVRGIAWVIFFGHHQLLQNLLNQIIQETGSVDDLFQNCFNKRIKPYSNMEHGVNEDDKKDHIHVPNSDISSDIGYCSNVGVDIKTGSYTGTDPYSDTKVYEDDGAHINTYLEPVIIEQCRLLCLGCYSGDLETVNILLKLINIEALNNKDWPSRVLYFEINPLIIACKYGYLDIAFTLLEADADIDISVGFNTPLTVACENEQKSIVRLLLKFGASVNKSNDQYTPLQCVCEKGYIDLVEELIKEGADVNLNVPLINACIKNHLSIVRRMIKEGANVNSHKNGESPLLAACEKGHFNVVKELIKSGADLNIKLNEKIPIIAACDSGYFNILKQLMKSGAKVEPKDKDKTILNFPCYWDHLSIVKRLIEMDSSFNLDDANEISLIVACYRGRVSKVKKMIKGGADVNKRDREKTPLIVACYKAYLQVVQVLIKAGADVNLGNEYISPLQVASYEGHFNIVKELNKAGLDNTQKNSVGKALMGAIFFGHLSVVQELITYVDVNLKYGKETPLTTACFMGHFNICKELIKAGADVNLSNGSRTPLTLACSRGHIVIVKELIKEGADVNQSGGKETPLTTACEKGQMEVVEELMKAGGNINQRDGNTTPLIAACEHGLWEVVYKLIKAEVDVNQSDGNKTPLIAACERGHWIVVKELIKARANVNQRVGNKTPLTVACEKGHRSVVKNLIKARTDVNQGNGKETPLINACMGGHLDVVDELIKSEVNVNQSIDNKTPLTAACERKHLGMISVLLKAGANVNQNNGNRTPLTAASERGYWDVINDLIKAGANVNQSDGNKTPLIAACERGHWHSVKKLLKAKANVNQCNGNKTPLTAACERGHLDVVRELIKARADVNQSDGNKTSLTTACKRGHLIVVKELINAGAGVNQIDLNMTPLTAASERGYWDVVTYLIKARANVNQSDGNKTPLIAACEKGHCYAVKKLIDAEADVNLCNRNKTPLTVACEKGHLDVVRQLIKAKADVNQCDGNKTPITAARSSVSLSELIVKHLIMAGANLN